jgi:diguanylate cyclase (GGDEF)-like protein
MDFIITNLTLPSIPVAVGLGAVATIGYIVGLRTRRRMAAQAMAAQQIELAAPPKVAQRTAIVAKELESIAEQLRRRLAEHHRSVATFQSRITTFCQSRPPEDWMELAREAQDILKPTIKLASELAQAYDGLRQQSTQLSSYIATPKTDSLTGAATRDALVEMLDLNLAMARRYGRPVSIAMFDIDEFGKINRERGRMFGDQSLRATARLINESIRERDMIARIGGEEFVVAMPETGLEESLISAERLRQFIEQRIGITVSVGVAEGTSDESTTELLARADVALNGAKAAGRNQVYAHDMDDVICFADRINDPEHLGAMAISTRGAMTIA